MSTIIIRLQNLPLSAKAADIREFFGDLKIPKGSVNIVGGPMGDAFIGFASDEDARLAMLLDGRLLHEAKIRLMLSSKREMEQVISNAQAQAGKPPPQQFSETQGMRPNLQKLCVGLSPPKSSQTDSGSLEKLEDNAPPAHIQAAPSFPFAQQLTAFQQHLSEQLQQPNQQAFSGDSWKTPQSFPPTSNASQQNVPVVQQQQQQLQSQASSQQQHQQQQQAPPVFLVATGQYGATSGPPAGGGPAPHSFQQQLPQPGQLPGFLSMPPGQQRAPLDFFNQRQNAPQNFRGGGAPPGVLRFPGGAAQVGQQQQPQQQQPFFGSPTSGQPGGGGPPQMQVAGGGVGPFARQQAQQQHQQRLQFSPQQQQQQYPHQQFPPPPRASAGIHPQHTFGQQHAMGMGGGPTQQNGPAAPPQFRGQLPPQQALWQQSQARFPLGQQHSFEAGPGAAGKRRINRSPSEESRKRLNMRPFISSAGLQEVNSIPDGVEPPPRSTEFGKGRFCVQLSNVPYKAAFNDINDYLSASRAVCIKVTRVYIPDKNYTDRWIVEFDNEDHARSLIKYRGDIFGRTIRAERIPPRRADEQYAVNEPEEREQPSRGRNRRTRDDDSSRKDSKQRYSRDRSRSRNRDRSREGGRQRERALSRDKGGNGREGGNGNGGSGTRQNRRSTSRNRLRTGSDGINSGGPRDRNRDSHREQRRESTEPQQSRQRRNSGPERRKDEQHTSDGGGRGAGRNGGEPGGGGAQMHPPVPLFGAFAFPSTQANQAVYNAKSGTTVQIGAKDGGGAGIKPMPLRAFPHPAHFFPNIPPSSTSGGRPLPLINQFLGGNQNGSARNGPPSESPTLPPFMLPPFRLPFGHPPHFPPGGPLPPNFCLNLRATGPNAMPLGMIQRPDMPQRLQQTPPKEVMPGSATFSASPDANSGGAFAGSALVIQEDNSSVEGKGNESGNEAFSTNATEGHHQIAQMKNEDNTELSTTPFIFSASTTIPDQPPLDLLEPDGALVKTEL